MSSPVALVTGGAGFIGSHIVEHLLDEGHHVVVVDDLSSGSRSNVADAAEFHQLDIRSQDAADLVVESGATVLVHHAAQMDVRRSVADPVFDASVNVLGTLNLLEAGRRGAVERFVFASTGGAIYGEQDRFPADENHSTRPLSPYGVTKLAAERYLWFYHVQYGLDVVCLRYANVYGERQNPHGEAGVVAIFLQKLLRGLPVTINGDGLQTRDYVHVSDVARANRAALDLEGFHILNIGTGIETNVVELHSQIAEILDISDPPRFGPAASGEQRRSSIDPALARKTLDLSDFMSLREGFERTAAWFAAQRRSDD